MIDTEALLTDADGSFSTGGFRDIMGRLDGKIAVVTGAASGIGRAIALRFAMEGARVLAADIAAAGVKETADAALSGEIVPHLCDVSSPEQVDQMFQVCQARLGLATILCNNAAIGSALARTHETRLEDWDRVFAVNARGGFLVLRAALAQMLKAGIGAVVNTASTASLHADPGTSPYGSTKGAMLMLTRTAAIEYARDNIRVNAICPGLTTTGMLAHLPAEAIERLSAQIPQGRLGTADEVANLALFLASDEASHITGAAYLIDGGRTAA